jgi:hypothetical protein
MTDDAAIVERLDQLTGEIRALRDEVRGLREPQRKDASELITVICEATQSLKFNVTELIEHAYEAADSRLHDALVATSAQSTAKSWGIFLPTLRVTRSLAIV